jgi:hypothetical protein
VNEHPALGPELRQLATTILAMLDPLLQSGAAAFASAAEGATPGKCAQVWCPVCAVAALASGEHHPLAATIAEHGAALLTLLRAAAGPDDPAPPDAGAHAADGDHQSHESGRYKPIPVTIHD